MITGIPHTSLRLCLTLILLAAGTIGSHAQQQIEPGALKAGQSVLVEYIPNSGKWIPGTIIEVANDGYDYKVKVAPWGDGRVIQTIIHFKRVRPAGKTLYKPQTTQTVSAVSSGKLVYGKYGCTASTWNNGAVEYTPRGSFVVSANGRYAYNGLSKASSGTFTIDSAGNLSFKGGYLDGGRAEKIDRPNKFFLTFPTNPDSRWTCGLASGQ